MFQFPGKNNAFFLEFYQILDKFCDFLNECVGPPRVSYLTPTPNLSQSKKKKESAQPTKVKTGGSTFKNPKDQTEKKVWELIKESVPNTLTFGDASISEKHANFFVNKNNASFKEMRKLISTVRDKVLKKTGISINTEIIIVE